MWYELLDNKKVLDAIRHELLRGGCPEEIVDDKVRDVVEEVFKSTSKTRGRRRASPRSRTSTACSPSCARGPTSARSTRCGTSTRANEVFAGSTEERHDQAAPASMDESTSSRAGPSRTSAPTRARRNAAITEGIAAGQTHKEIAKEHNLSHGHVRNVASSLGERHRPRLRKSGLRPRRRRAGGHALLLRDAPSTSAATRSATAQSRRRRHHVAVRTAATSPPVKRPLPFE